MNTYEKILNEDGTDAEAYWSLVLCRYGIEYVEDPATHKRVPTINRTQYTSIYADENYKSAIEYADSSQKIVYENEAKAIDDIQKGILEISSKELPFDVFICYKETDQNGRRTQDSVLANDLYHQLTQEGFKVFFSRITLEDKLGTAYEPYIFAALNSSKVMVVLGTKPEYFNAVWVKNEWSRYLALISNGQKKMLIPAYRDMDPYDLPEEFSHLQAQDMSKLGFMQDLIRGIKKIIGTEKVNEKPIIVENNVASSAIGNVNALIKRGNMALEDGEWHRADEFFEEVLNQDAECSQAYLGKWMAKLNVSKTDQIIKHYVNKYDNPQAKVVEACPKQTEHINQMATEYYIDKYLSKTEIEHMYAFDRTFESHLDSRIELEKQAIEEIDSERLYHRALQYAVGEEKNALNDIRNELKQILGGKIDIEKSNDLLNANEIESEYKKIINQIDENVKDLHNKAELRKENDYSKIIQEFNNAKSVSEYTRCRDELAKFDNYSNTQTYIEKCNQCIIELKEKNRKKKRKIILAIGSLVVACTIVFEIMNIIVIPRIEHNRAVAEVHKRLMKMEQAKEGEIVEFGKNRKIKWRILKKNDNKMLLISENIICLKPYNENSTSTAWEDSSLREWLNNEYFDEMFWEEEQKHISVSNIVNSYKSKYHSSGGNDTKDKIFLLSFEEAKKYFTSNQDRTAKNINDISEWWWLRSPSDGESKILVVNNVGYISNSGFDVENKGNGVRPAMWISLK